MNANASLANFAPPFNMKCYYTLTSPDRMINNWLASICVVRSQKCESASKAEQGWAGKTTRRDSQTLHSDCCVLTNVIRYTSVLTAAASYDVSKRKRNGCDKCSSKLIQH